MREQIGICRFLATWHASSSVSSAFRSPLLKVYWTTHPSLRNKQTCALTVTNTVEKRPHPSRCVSQGSYSPELHGKKSPHPRGKNWFNIGPKPGRRWFKIKPIRGIFLRSCYRAVWRGQSVDWLSASKNPMNTPSNCHEACPNEAPAARVTSECYRCDWRLS